MDNEGSGTGTAAAGPAAPDAADNTDATEPTDTPRAPAAGTAQTPTGGSAEAPPEAGSSEAVPPDTDAIEPETQGPGTPAVGTSDAEGSDNVVEEVAEDTAAPTDADSEAIAPATVTEPETTGEEDTTEAADTGPLPVEALCELLVSAADGHGVPQDFFIRLIFTESRFDAGAVSPVGAQGIAQFMPYTARERGLADPFDPEQALPASAAFLAELEARFGNWGLAAAGYNGGPNRVANWIETGGALPRETVNYVYAITGRTVEQWRAFALAARKEAESGDPSEIASAEEGTDPDAKAGTAPTATEADGSAETDRPTGAPTDGAPADDRDARDGAPQESAAASVSGTEDAGHEPEGDLAGGPLADVTSDPAAATGTDTSAEDQLDGSGAATGDAASETNGAPVNQPAGVLRVRIGDRIIRAPAAVAGSAGPLPGAPIGRSLRAPAALAAASDRRFAHRSAAAPRRGASRVPSIRPERAPGPVDCTWLVASLGAMRVTLRPPDGFGAGGSPWGAQVAGHPRRNAALAMYRRIENRIPADLRGRQPSVVVRRFAARGRLPIHAVQFGAASRREAAATCRRLSAALVPCVVTRNR